MGGSPVDEARGGMVVLVSVVRIDVLVARLDVPAELLVPLAKIDVLSARFDVLVEMPTSEACHSIWNIGASRVRRVCTVADPFCVVVEGDRE